VRALRPECLLILAGDKDQLASVDAGSVLADICETEYGVVELQASHRFSAKTGIGKLARAIRENSPDDVLQLLTSFELEGIAYHPTSERKSLDDLLFAFASDHYAGIFSPRAPEERLSLLSRARILTAHRQGPYGSEHLNDIVEEILRQRKCIKEPSLWYDGRPVMVVKNNYEIDLFNGDLGVICKSGEGRDDRRAFFDFGPSARRSIHPARLPPCETAFAMTVHKAQGSEFDSVLVVLPDQATPVLTRELLYTAVTRAQKEVILFGHPDIVAQAVQTRTARTSGLADRLRRHVAL